MKHRSPVDPDPPRLSESAAARLLARASELDAARGTGSAICDLRAAATEAGISARAFDAALAELQGGATMPASVAPTKRHQCVRAPIAIGGLAAALVVLTFAVGRSRVPVVEASVRSAPLVDEAILLRCLAPEDATELIRPLLTLPTNTVVIRPAQGSRVVSIRATPAQIAEVQAALDCYEGAENGACASRAAEAPPPR